MKKLTAIIAALMIMVCGCAACFAEQQTITREEALKIALDYAGLKEDQITLTRTHQDRDDGRQIWDIEFYCNGVEYDFNVDMLSGQILEADQDREYHRDRDYGRYYDDDDDRYDDHDDWDDWFDFD